MPSADLTCAPRNGELRGTSDRRLQVLTWVALSLSALAIIGAARGDLWLDEIWSLAFARNARSVADIFVRFHNDNNHPLNTLFLHFLGNPQALIVYRLLAILCGVGSVYLASRIARADWGGPEALGATILTGASFPLLLYFSEARGYAPALFFALAGYAAWRRISRRFGTGTLLGFWACAVLGFLSHATFILAAMAFLAGSLVQEIRTAGPLAKRALRVAVLHLPPLVFFAGWYVFFLRPMTIGKGPILGTGPVIGQAAALLLGLPDAPGFRAAAVILTLALIAAGILSLRDERRVLGAFFLTVLLAAPALLLLLSRPQFLYFRYLIVCFPFFLLLLARAACEAARRLPARWRWVPWVALALVVAGQVPRDFRLLTVGRGQYSAAFQYVVEHSPPGVVRIASDQDFRNEMLFDFYAPRVPPPSHLRYVERAQWFVETPDWFLVHSQDASFQPLATVSAEGAGLFRLVKTYPYAGYSGWTWYLYQRVK